jgi:hypothetical protein
VTDPTTPEPTSPVPPVAPVAPPTAPPAPPVAPPVPPAPAPTAAVYPPTAAYPPAAPAYPPTAPGYPPAAPGYAPAGYPPVYAPAAAGPKQGLSLTSFILAIAGFLFAFAFGFGLIISVAAVILGFIGRKREPGAPTWMSLVGIIGGFVGILIALIIGGLFVFAIVGAAVAGDAYGNF